jgi:hypothetical protein
VSVSFFGQEGPNRIKITFSQGQKALIRLSKDVFEQRLSLTQKVRSSYSFLKTTTLVSVFIGMITTILVSISSTEFGRGDGRSQRLIRVLAIVFPALGTATAALIGFYNPQAEWAQASRTLAAETQLHGQMALEVWKLPCPKIDADVDARPLTDDLDEWSKRYVDIETISTASGAQGGGSPPAGNPPAGNPPAGNPPAGNPPAGNRPP